MGPLINKSAVVDYLAAIEKAISMDKEEQYIRMESMTNAVESYTVNDWAEDQIKGIIERID